MAASAERMRGRPGGKRGNSPQKRRAEDRPTSPALVSVKDFNPQPYGGELRKGRCAPDALNRLAERARRKGSSGSRNNNVIIVNDRVVIATTSLGINY